MALPWYVQQALDQARRRRAAEAKTKAQRPPRLLSPGGRPIFPTVLQRTPRVDGQSPPRTPAPAVPTAPVVPRQDITDEERIAREPEPEPSALESFARSLGRTATEVIGTSVGRTAGLVGAIQARQPITEIPGTVMEAGRTGAAQLEEAARGPVPDEWRLEVVSGPRTWQELKAEIGALFQPQTSGAPSGPRAPSPYAGRVPIGTQKTIAGQVYEVVTADASGNPVWRQVGSPGPRPFEEEMVALAVQTLEGATEQERNAALQRYQERLRFVNLGFGGAQAEFNAAVVNASLNMAQGRFSDFMSDAIARELPWSEQGFNSYQEYLTWLGYEDLGNGMWRKLRPVGRAELGLGPVTSGARGTARSGAPGTARRGFGSFIGLVNWRV